MTYHPHDSYYRNAKREGYRSRAAYKLLELQRRFRLLHPGDVVIDLGAAPGGWLQVAAKIVGQQGKVLGIDLQPIDALPERNVLILQADINAADTGQKIKELVLVTADCILSDLAPRLSGIRETDAARCLELNLTALEFARRWLKPGGSFLAKSFVAEDNRLFLSAIKKHFGSAQRTRPEATRKGSSEMYFCAKDFHPAPPDPDR